MNRIDELIESLAYTAYECCPDSFATKLEKKYLRAKFDQMQESLEKILDIASSSDPYRINLIIHNAMVGLGLKDEPKE